MDATPLVEVLDIEQLDVDLYRGFSPEDSIPRVFGGQVAGQALVAAWRTVEGDRPVHSMHAYFLRGGDPEIPIVFHVDRIRDGRSFTTRRVVAKQRGKAIFNLAASFHVVEPGLEHAVPMPPVAPPDEPREDGHGLGPVSERIAAQANLELRPARLDADHDGRGGTRAPVWFRSKVPLSDDPLHHLCTALFASDLTLLGAAVLPHDVDWRQLMPASLDHAMWFHRPFRVDDWVLYDKWSPFAGGARGISHGRMFTADGQLVASVSQEGLIRPIDPDHQRSSDKPPRLA